MEANNMAAMREALNHSLVMIHKLHYLARSIELDNETKKCVDEIEAALLLHVRNCDVGTAEEQAERMDAYCASHGVRIDSGWRCEKCPLCSIDRCELVWAQMPYMKGE